MADFAIAHGGHLPSTQGARSWTDAVFVKMALEGKGFQAARAEAQAALPAPTVAQEERPAALPAGVATFQSTALAWELSLQQVSIQLREEGPSGIRSVDLRLTRIQAAITGPAAPAKDPLVIALDGSNPATSGKTGARLFDLAGDGALLPTSFVSERTAFLALDRNKNGRIDDGGELFGDQHGAANGFAELRRFDANRDNLLDVADPVFPRLRLWFGNGTMASLSEEGLRALALEDRPAARLTTGGDEVFREAVAHLEGGGTVGTYALNLASFEAEA